MAIVSIRANDHLICGQVATVWSLVMKANYTMVVDDLVVRDVVNEGALRMACPQQCKLSILTVGKAAENLKTGKYDEERVLIIAKDLKTIRELLNHGFQIETINVSSIDGRQNTKMLERMISVSQEDTENSPYLVDHGVKVTAQMAPTDEVPDFVELVKRTEA